MKVTVEDVINHKCDVRQYLGYNEEKQCIYVSGEELDMVLIDKSDEWERLREQVNKLESFKRSAEYTVDSVTLELIISNQKNDIVLSLSETYDEEIYLLKKRVQELEDKLAGIRFVNNYYDKQNKRYKELIDTIIYRLVTGDAYDKKTVIDAIQLDVYKFMECEE